MDALSVARAAFHVSENNPFTEKHTRINKRHIDRVQVGSQVKKPRGQMWGKRRIDDVIYEFKIIKSLAIEKLTFKPRNLKL